MLLYPYNPNSESAKNLAASLGIKRVKHEGKAMTGKTIINWGASTIKRELIDCAIINKPEAVAAASNKLSAFKLMKKAGVGIPEFTEDVEEAKKWLADSRMVFARTKLNAHSGEGIVIVDPDDKKELPEAKLYTRYIPKSTEYRIHVYSGEVFFIQKKARKMDVPDEKVNWKIRNHQNGFIYANDDVQLEDKKSAFASAASAVAALGLDFGAVDLIYNIKQGKYFVLEVNTAPGLTGKTLEAYYNLFKE